MSGRVVQGQVRTGEKVVVMPLEDPATATRLERNGAPARTARAGDNAEMTLSGVDAARVVVGNVVCKAGRVLPAVRRFNAQIVALPALEVGLGMSRRPGGGAGGQGGRFFFIARHALTPFELRLRFGHSKT